MREPSCKQSISDERRRGFKRRRPELTTELGYFAPENL
jgi:hypothetical protein